MFGSHDRVCTPLEKKEALKRAATLEMNAADIAYFLEINGPVAYENLVRRRNRNGPLNRYRIALFGPGESFNYRQASQIYELMDAGFTSQDLQEDVFTARMIDYAQKHRPEIEPKIITALKVLYPERGIDKPYLEKKKSSK